ncbi:MAG: peptidylprolyl isomerase [Polyangiales bacterium]
MRAAVVVSALTAIAACNGGERRTGDGSPLADGRANIGGNVVATVDGRPITVARVAAVVRATGLAPSDALRRLEDEELLASEAAKRGMGERAVVQRILKQAAVQKLLHEAVEVPMQAANVPAKEVDKVFEQRRDSLSHPEQRASVHILVRVKPGAAPDVDAKAKLVAQRAITDLRRAVDYDVLVDSLNGTFRDGVQLYAERVPALARDSRADKAYLDAMFALPAPGVVDHPVRSMFGWHAIAVAKIIPPSTADRHAADARLRESLVVPMRKRQLGSLLDAVRKRVTVERDEGAISNMVVREFEIPE